MKFWKKNMKIKIEKDIVPDKLLPRMMKYPWLTMEIGDSFEVATSLRLAKTNARQAGIRYKREYDAQMYKGRVRIWRWK